MDQYDHGEIAVRIVAKFHFTDPSKSKAWCQKSKSCNKVKSKKCKIKIKQIKKERIHESLEKWIQFLKQSCHRMTIVDRI